MSDYLDTSTDPGPLAADVATTAAGRPQAVTLIRITEADEQVYASVVGYNISDGHVHAMIDPSMLDNYTGPCEFAVAGRDGFQWYTGTLVGPASTPGERRWTIEHVGIALTRAASHIAIPIQGPTTPLSTT